MTLETLLIRTGVHHEFASLWFISVACQFGCIGRLCRSPGHRLQRRKTFLYSDGTTQRRVWHLTRHDDGRYTGRADDVIGVAEGQTSGNAFRWQYTLLLPVNGREYQVQFDDWMFQIDDQVMLNRARMSKFGITLGEVLLSFSKEVPDAS